MFGKEGEARVKAMAVVLVVVVMAAVCMAADACSPFAYDRYESVWEEREREHEERGHKRIIHAAFSLRRKNRPAHKRPRRRSKGHESIAGEEDELSLCI